MIEILRSGGTIVVEGPCPGEVFIMSEESEIDITSVVVQGFVGDEYDGPYVVIPKVSQQVLETNEKLMRDDVTVRGVPRYDVHNEYGITCSIAVEV